jgi:hypothetical protein
MDAQTLPSTKAGRASGRLSQAAITIGSFTNVGHQRHESRTLDRGAGGSLKRRATATALARKHLVLVRAQFFEQTDVLVIDIGWSGAAISSAKPAAILTVASKLLARHKPDFL